MNYPERRIEALQLASPMEQNLPLQVARRVTATPYPGDPGVSLAHFTKISSASRGSTGICEEGQDENACDPKDEDPCCNHHSIAP